MSDQPANRGGPIYWLKRRSRRFWIIAIALLPVFYVASFGPACWCVYWLDSRYGRKNGLAEGLAGHACDSIGLPFIPCGWLAMYGPNVIGLPLRCYAALVVPAHDHFRVPIGFRDWWGMGNE